MSPFHCRMGKSVGACHAACLDALSILLRCCCRCRCCYRLACDSKLLLLTMMSHVSRHLLASLPPRSVMPPALLKPPWICAHQPI